VPVSLLDAVECRCHFQHLPFTFCLRICGQEHSPPGTQRPVFIGTQFKSGTTGLTLTVYNMTAVELRLAKRRRELEMLFLTFVFQAEFVIPGRAPDVAGVVITGG